MSEFTRAAAIWELGEMFEAGLLTAETTAIAYVLTSFFVQEGEVDDDA